MKVLWLAMPCVFNQIASLAGKLRISICTQKAYILTAPATACFATVGLVWLCCYDHQSCCCVVFFSAGLHSSLTRQQQVLTAWRAETARRIHLHAVLTACLQRWSQLAASRAFEQWKSWALHRAGLQRKAKAVMSLLAGRTLQWAFSMLRCGQCPELWLHKQHYSGLVRCASCHCTMWLHAAFSMLPSAIVLGLVCFVVTCWSHV